MSRLQVDERHREKPGSAGKTKIQFVPIAVSVFLLSFSILSLEVALTRIFSILFSYHYVFSVISMVLFGLGIG
ncbi:MAG TPA: hypothetical protein ENI27_04605, partial [bacterium]|nr:hypothetical protein [bacterium]